MMLRRVLGILLLAFACPSAGSRTAFAQCCLTDLFAGCGSCFRRAPAYAVAPVAPVMAPVVAPVPAPPPPMMVPVQQVSYVPETTYRTQYQSVPVTTYKPSCEIDPCTGCPRECMQPVTQYVQQAVNVPVTQYRAVTTTKYVQMQPGYAGVVNPAAAPSAFAAPPAGGPAAAAVSPFAAPVQPQPASTGWAPAGAGVPPQPGLGQPAIPQGGGVPGPTYQQQITPQTGNYPPLQAQSPMLHQPPASPGMPSAPSVSSPPAYSPTPSLKPIPEMPKAAPSAGTSSGVPSGTGGGSAPRVELKPTPGPAATAPGPQGMPILPGEGPSSSTRAFPRLLEPAGHTTSWQPAEPAAWVSTRPAYPTASLPARLQQ